MANFIGQRLGQYEIVGLLGRGGMASVYRAQQLNIKREVAIKVIKPELLETGDFIKRFQREAETLANLKHPHIVKLFDYGQSDDVVYLVMELLTAGSLADLLHKGPLSLTTTTKLVEQIASALDYAHKQAVVHRDLKPQNILLDEDGNAFLTDFGIAKLLSENTAFTQSGATVGTPAYMAPEQWQGHGVEARTDVYALGIILFEMLVGKLPFQADTPYSMMHMHVNETPPLITSSRDGIPAGVDSVIAKALSKRPEDRFASATGLAVAFTSVANVAPITGMEMHQAGTYSVRSQPEEAQADTQVTIPPTLIPAAPVRKRPALLVSVIAILTVIVVGLLLSTTRQLSQPATPTLPNSASLPQNLAQIGAIPTVDCLVQSQTLTALQTAVRQATLEAASYQATFVALRKEELTATP